MVAYGKAMRPSLVDVMEELNGLEPYTLPTASAETLGGVKVGSGLAIDNAGVLSASGGSGGSGTGGTVTIQETGSTLNFNALKAIAQSNNPTVTATILGTLDSVYNVYSRVLLTNLDIEGILITTSVVYSNAFNAIGYYTAGTVNGTEWKLLFYDIEGQQHNIGEE